LFFRRFSLNFCGVSAIIEIERAIESLSPTEQARLRDWLLKRSSPTGSGKPKTGTELAAVWPARFHLAPKEADELARDLETDRRNQTVSKPPAWE
jgi:hypothetical protein